MKCYHREDEHLYEIRTYSQILNYLYPTVKFDCSTPQKFVELGVKALEEG